MSQAESYCEQRRNNLSRPCSWLKRYWDELEADQYDLEYLSKATFLPDGATIVFEDGSSARKVLTLRRTPWIAY